MARTPKERLRIQSVWNKAQEIADRDPSKWRQDDYGCTIQFSKYGDRDSIFGWEFDHVIPKAEGGSDALFNLRPLNWQANLARNRDM